jgi:hypothetical protein
MIIISALVGLTYYFQIKRQLEKQLLLQILKMMIKDPNMNRNVLPLIKVF